MNGVSGGGHSSRCQRNRVNVETPRGWVLANICRREGVENLGKVQPPNHLEQVVELNLYPHAGSPEAETLEDLWHRCRCDYDGGGDQDGDTCDGGVGGPRGQRQTIAREEMGDLPGVAGGLLPNMEQL